MTTCPAAAPNGAERTPTTIAAAPRSACAGSTNVAKNPSPAVSCSRPPQRLSSSRTSRRNGVKSSRQRASPTSDASDVDPTMSRARSRGGQHPRTSHVLDYPLGGGRCLDLLDGRDQVLHRLLRVAEEHRRPRLGVQLVVDPREPGSHRTLEHDHLL